MKPSAYIQHHVMCVDELVWTKDKRFNHTPLFKVPEGYVLVPNEILERFKELNPSNYSHDDVCKLNDWACELVLAAAPKGEQK